MSLNMEFGSLGLAIWFLAAMLGSICFLSIAVCVYSYLANTRRRRLTKTLRHCGLEEYHAKNQEDLQQYGYLQRAPYDVSGIDVQDGVNDDQEFLQMMRDLRVINKQKRDQERYESDYWAGH